MTIDIHQDWIERLTVPPDNWQTGYFMNTRQICIQTARAIPAGPVKGQVMYVEGLNEVRQKTYELARDFNRHACRFDVFDRAFQGHSSRALKSRFKIHSRSMFHDVEDVIQYAEQHMSRDSRITLLGHSTGGLIALMAYHDRPDLFTPPFLNAPLIGMKHKWMKGREEKFGNLNIPEKIQELYIPGGRDWRLRGTGGLLPPDAYSSHPERMKQHDHVQEKHPYLRAGDPTIGWIWRACHAMVWVRNPSWLREVGPVTIATAGHDFLTDNDQVIRLMEHISQVQHIHFNNGKHESPFETDDIRDRVIGETVKLALNG